ncbi:unnamed protein product [Discosporangium mesarthrocarpum]
MSATTAHNTLHQFCCAFMQDMYDKWIVMAEGQELQKVTRAYECLGFPSAVGSTDSTHVRWDMAPYMEAVHCNGKEDFPSIDYEITVGHTECVLGVTAGLLGAKNDKTMIRFDKLIQKDQVEAHVRPPRVHTSGCRGDRVCAKRGVCHHGWRIPQGMEVDWLWD